MAEPGNHNRPEALEAAAGLARAISRSKKILFVVAIYFALLFLAAYSGYVVSMGTPVKNVLRRGDAVATGLVPLPVIDVSLAAANGRARISLMLEVAVKDTERLQSYIPRIVDRIQIYMNRFTPEELKGRSSLRWLYDDLLLEVNTVSGPIRILSIMLRELVFYQ